jgi:hypothetical protein
MQYRNGNLRACPGGMPGFAAGYADVIEWRWRTARVRRDRMSQAPGPQVNRGDRALAGAGRIGSGSIW